IVETTWEMGDKEGLKTGGIYRTSEESGLIKLSIKSGNDAPVIDPDWAEKGLDMPPIDEDDFESDGANVKDMFEKVFTDPKDQGADKDSFAGILVTSVPSDPAKGAWQYKGTDGEWHDMQKGDFIGAESGVRFVPVADYNGNPPAITVRIVETRSAQEAQEGFGHDYVTGENFAVDTMPVGGSTQVSANTIDLRMHVNPINDAPHGTGDASLDPIGTDRPVDRIPGKTVAELVGGFFSDDADDRELSDADKFAGVIVVGNAATGDQGNWQYFDGQSWVELPRGEFAGQAVVLPADALIRFVPKGNFIGTPGELTVRVYETPNAEPEALSGEPALDKAGDIVDGNAHGGGKHRISADLVSIHTKVLDYENPPPPYKPWVPEEIVKIIDEHHWWDDYGYYFGLELKDLYVEIGRLDVFYIPSASIHHWNNAERITLYATLDDGSALPDWISFDPYDRAFRILPHEGCENVTVKVCGYDEHGNYAETRFRVFVNDPSIWHGKGEAERPLRVPEVPADEAGEPAETGALDHLPGESLSEAIAATENQDQDIEKLVGVLQTIDLPNKASEN
ncbi:MAG: hypothetical protein HUK26_03595, partial [Duodenibacillus sp.]|nr:hypothetical protein [Duodenibacillus sp.]